MIAVLIYILGIISIIATFIKLIKSDAWWIRGFDFPQVQIASIGILAAAGTLLLFPLVDHWGNIAFFALLVASLIYQGYIIFPYTMFYPRQSLLSRERQKENNISLAVSNVYMYNREYAKCLKVLQKWQPDILILVETDKAWQEGVSALEEDYPYTVFHALDNTYGMLLYSKLPLSDTQLRFLVRDGIPSITTSVTLRSGREIRLYAVHPEPPSPTENERSTERDAELYIVGREIREIKKPVIVAGDLNDVAWSRTTKIFQRLSGVLDPRMGRGFFNTFSTKYWLLRWPLDHIFHSYEFKVGEIKRLPHIGSDHFPMFISLYYEPDPESRLEKPETSYEEDKIEIEEKIEEVNGDSQKN